MFFCDFTYGIDINTNADEGTSFQIQYISSQSSLPALADYDIMQRYINADANGSLHLDVPIEIDQFTLSTSDVQFLSISTISVSLFGFPINIYGAEQLLENIETVQNIVFDNIGNNVIYFSNREAISLIVTDFLVVPMFASIILVIWLVSIISGIIASRKFYSCSPTILMGGIILISPMLSYGLFELITNNFSYISQEYRILNYLIILMFYLILFIISNKPWLSVCICNWLLLIVGIINYFVLQFRGKPVLPWDIYAISTATSILDGYDFEITYLMWYAIIVLGIFSLLLFKNKTSFTVCKRKKVIPMYILSVLIPILIFNSQSFSNIACHYWDTDIVYQYKTKGGPASFFKYVLNSKISKPENYNPNLISELDIQEISTPVTTNAIQPQNIIMIMNESFTDFQALGCEYPEDILPYYHSLASKSIYGNLYVSVRGGSTCNTEFEALTGNSLVFLPSGSFPFQTYMRNGIYSLPRYLKENGFSCVGLHFEDGKNWNRNNAYSILGFDSFFDINDFENIESVRGRVTDEFNYEEIIRIIENSDAEKNFIFNTTIQNHGGYNGFYDLPPSVEILSDSDLENAEVYLSLIKLSDDALQKLVTYFENIDTPTMIIFFGDHQPKMDDLSEEYLFSESIGNNFEKYITPFLIYRNYSSESYYIEKMSANYLSSLILDIGNFELPTFYQLLLQTYNEFPVMTIQGIEDKHGNYYAYFSDVPESELLSTYESLQYYNMFDNP